MARRFLATPEFWRSFSRLSDSQREAAEATFHIFRENPFDQRLGTHRINSLSARLGRTVFSVWIQPDLRAVFYLDGEDVVSLDIGSHAIYR
jgi:hypothetical protein